MQLNLHKLVRNLNKLCLSLRQEYNINCGGCCYVAYEIARHLDKFQIPYSLCIISYNKLNKQSIIREVLTRRQNEKYNNSVTGDNTCTHYYLRVVSGGDINKGNFRDRTYTITNVNHKHLSWLYNTGNWNTRYDIDNNSIIKQIINSHFKHYGKAYKNNLCISENRQVSLMLIFSLTKFVRLL